jgi:hypothetical protein
MGTVAKFGNPTGALSGSLTGNSGANSLYLTKYITGNKDISNITQGFVKHSNNGATVKIKMVVYADSSGSPAALIATSNEVTNPTGTAVFQAFTYATPFSLTPATAYWLGYITDNGFPVFTNTTNGQSLGPRLGWNASATPAISYASGPPATLSGGTPSFGSATFSNLTDMYLQGSYSGLVFATPEFTPCDGFGNSGGNELLVAPFVAQDTLSGTDAFLQVNTTNSTAKMKLVVYADSAGSPGSLIAASNEVVGPTAGWQHFVFGTPVSITAGTQYWYGTFADSVVVVKRTGPSNAKANAATYAFGVPTTFPTSGMTTTVGQNLYIDGLAIVPQLQKSGLTVARFLTDEDELPVLTRRFAQPAYQPISGRSARPPWQVDLYDSASLWLPQQHRNFAPPSRATSVVRPVLFVIT